MCVTIGFTYSNNHKHVRTTYKYYHTDTMLFSVYVITSDVNKGSKK